MSEMTASELYEVVKDVPREAWPENVGYSPALRSFEWADELEHVLFPDQHAALMFVGSMVAWLATYGEVVVTPTFDSGGVSYVSIQVCSHDWIGGKTLIEALAAACKGVQ